MHFIPGALVEASRFVRQFSRRPAFDKCFCYVVTQARRLPLFRTKRDASTSYLIYQAKKWPELQQFRPMLRQRNRSVMLLVHHLQLVQAAV